MRRTLGRSDIYTLLWVGAGVLLSTLSILMVASKPMTPTLQHIVDATCPHWTEC